MPETAAEIVLRLGALTGAERLLLAAPGPHGAELLNSVLAAFSKHSRTVLESSRERLLQTRNPEPGTRNPEPSLVQARATRLPFVKHSFDAVISLESLYAIRPPWTVLAEFHRVLKPDGKLLMLEPARHGFFSRLRDRISGPGQRVFALEEIKYRLARGDYEIQELAEFETFPGLPWPAYCLRALKKENPVEPVPQYLTAREMIERRKKKTPIGEELP